MRRKSVKVFIRRDGELCELMWTELGPDGSVMMGLLGEVAEEVEYVHDAVRGTIRKPDFATQPNHGTHKISFHPSGRYKLMSKLGLGDHMLDRVTVDGPPLADIAAPRRMLEIVLPRSLPISSRTPKEPDIILTSQAGDGGPLRCTVSCMSKDEHRRLSELGPPTFVDTSRWECTGTLDSPTHTWTWTLRSSKEDQGIPDRCLIALIGAVRWSDGAGHDDRPRDRDAR